MSWLLWLLFSVFCITAATLLQRIVSRTSTLKGPALATLTLWTGTLILQPLAIIREFDIQDQDGNIPVLGIVISTVLYAIGAGMRFEALRITPAAHFIVVYASRAIWTTIIALLFLDGSFSFIQIVGVAVLVTAMLYASYDTTRIRLNKGFWITVLAGLAIGTGLGNDSYVIDSGVDIISYLAVLQLLIASVLSLANPRQTREAFQALRDRSFALKIVGLGALFVLAPLSFLYSIDLAPNAAVVTTVNQLQIILVAIGGVFILDERERIAQKLIGAVLATIGVLLLVL